MRRTLTVVTLAVALAALCLAVGGQSCRPKPDERVACKRVVGTPEADVQVFWCRHGDVCWYANNLGHTLVVACVEHPIARETRKEVTP